MVSYRILFHSIFYFLADAISVCMKTCLFQLSRRKIKVKLDKRMDKGWIQVEIGNKSKSNASGTDE